MRISEKKNTFIIYAQKQEIEQPNNSYVFGEYGALISVYGKHIILPQETIYNGQIWKILSCNIPSATRIWKLLSRNKPSTTNYSKLA
jgi:hypothetical protein